MDLRKLKKLIDLVEDVRNIGVRDLLKAKKKLKLAVNLVELCHQPQITQRQSAIKFSPESEKISECARREFN